MDESSPKGEEKVNLDLNRVFAYIISTVDSNYRVTGCVPCVEDGKVFLGPCKRRMRPEVRKGDYIMGISGSSAPNPRRVLLWMRVEEVMTFKEAWNRGADDATFRGLRGWAIHIRPRQGAETLPSPDCYEHIADSPHEDDWQSDVRGDRDVFLVGDPSSWVVSDDGPEVTPELMEFLKVGITWEGDATLNNPLTQNAVGKHVLLTGETADRIIKWTPRLKTVAKAGRSETGCKRACSCE